MKEDLYVFLVVADYCEVPPSYFSRPAYRTVTNTVSVKRLRVCFREKYLRSVLQSVTDIAGMKRSTLDGALLCLAKLVWVRSHDSIHGLVTGLLLLAGVADIPSCCTASRPGVESIYTRRATTDILSNIPVTVLAQQCSMTAPWFYYKVIDSVAKPHICPQPT